MTASEILSEAANRGLRIQLRGEKLIITGTGPRPVQLLEAIRSNKPGIVADLLARDDLPGKPSEESEGSEKSQNQTPIFPPIDMALPCSLPTLPAPDRTRVIDLVMRQGKPAIGWCLKRANAYFEKFRGSSFEDQDAAAAQDLLAWQGSGRPNTESKTR